MDQKDIDRINVLYHKYKNNTITEEESVERDKLRKEYIKSFKENLRGQLNQIDVEEEDGSIINLGEKYGKKDNNE